MAESLIPSVNRVELNPVESVNQALQTHSSQAAAAKPLTNGAVSMPSESESKGRAEVKPENRPPGPFKDVTLKFKIDEKTNEITILILDRLSRKVVRSIPPEEMAKMDPGELLELFT